MAAFDKSKPSVPAIFAWIMLKMAQDAGLDRKALADGLGLPEGMVGSSLSRISVLQFEELCRRFIRVNGNKPTLGYHLGLRMGLSTAGIVGVAGLTRATLRGAIEFMIRFSPLASGLAQYRFFEEDDCGVIEVRLPYEEPPDLYRYIYDWMLVGLWRMGVPLLGEGSRDTELWFNYPEPEYYPAFREKLPRCRFDMGANQICVPAQYLDRPLASGDPITAEQLEAQCRKELELLGGSGDAVARVRTFLDSAHGYPDLARVSEQLFMSARTLNRKLQQKGTSFQELLDQARRAEASELLRHSELSIESIAEKLGYADPGSFSHAFRRWTGVAPGVWRKGR